MDVTASEMNKSDLPGSSQDLSNYGAIEIDVTARDVARTDAKTEFKEISKNSGPLILTFVLQMSLSFVTVIFVGRLSAVDLGGVSLANVTFTATSGIFQGLATCLDTLCPQAYGGKRFKLVGLYFQRGLAISFAFAIPIAVLWWYSNYVLGLVVDDLRLVDIACRYLRVMIAAIPGYVMFECGKKYLQAQNDYTTGQYILFVCAPLNVVLNYLFVFKFALGFIGAPIATSLIYTLMGFSLATYIWHQNRNLSETNCWSPLSEWRPIFSNWMTMISLALPGIVMVEAEFLAFESLTVISAKFGTESLAAQSVIASIQTLTFEVPFSVGVAASNRIAYYIGKGRLRDCQIATRTTLVSLACVVGIANFSTLILGRHAIPAIFSNDPEVIHIASQVLPIIGLNQILDVFSVLSAGVLRAQGRQRIGGILNIIAYYVVGLPMAVVFGFRWNLGLRGLWMGLGCGIALLSMSLVYCVSRSNWTKILLDSQQLHKRANA